MPQTVARINAKILQVAAMDFHLCPMEVMKKELEISTQQVYNYRNTDLYRETVKELQDAWKEKMLQTPGTTELRKTINYGLSIAVKKLVHMLAIQKTPNRDIIAAARLMAQLDGRFLGTSGEDGHVDKDTESIAQELITAIRRDKETVQ